MRDSITGTQLKRVISPVSVADNTPLVGEIIDHQGYDAAAYLLLMGSLADADATFAVLLEERDTPSDGFTPVADADMVSQTQGTAPETAASFTFDHDNQVRKIGYIGSKRYTRLTVTPANNTGAALIAAGCLLSRPAPGMADAAQATA